MTTINPGQPGEERRNVTTGKHTRLGPLVAAFVTSIAMCGGSVGFGPRRRPQALQRPCIVCGELHHGNNAFCSAECCRLHREEAKRIRERT